MYTYTSSTYLLFSNFFRAEHNSCKCLIFYPSYPHVELWHLKPDLWILADWSKGSSRGQAQLFFCRFWFNITNSPCWAGWQGHSLAPASAVRVQELLAAVCHPVKQKRMLVDFNVLCWEGPGTALWAVISAATMGWRWWVVVWAVPVSLSLLVRQTLRHLFQS